MAPACTDSPQLAHAVPHDRSKAQYLDRKGRIPRPRMPGAHIMRLRALKLTRNGTFFMYG